MFAYMIPAISRQLKERPMHRGHMTFTRPSMSVVDHQLHVNDPFNLQLLTPTRLLEVPRQVLQDR